MTFAGYIENLLSVSDMPFSTSVSDLMETFFI